MVEDSRTTTRVDGLRPLGEPRPIAVTAARDGMPISVRWRQRWLTVLQVEEVWRVAEAWWRDELLARTYYQLSVEDGRLLTLFHDDTQTADCGWFEQRY